MEKVRVAVIGLHRGMTHVESCLGSHELAERSKGGGRIGTDETYPCSFV